MQAWQDESVPYLTYWFTVLPHLSGVKYFCSELLAKLCFSFYFFGFTNNIALCLCNSAGTCFLSLVRNFESVQCGKMEGWLKSFIINFVIWVISTFICSSISSFSHFCQFTISAEWFPNVEQRSFQKLFFKKKTQARIRSLCFLRNNSCMHFEKCLDEVF